MDSFVLSVPFRFVLQVELHALFAGVAAALPRPRGAEQGCRVGEGSEVRDLRCARKHFHALRRAVAFLPPHTTGGDGNFGESMRCVLLFLLFFNPRAKKP